MTALRRLWHWLARLCPVAWWRDRPCPELGEALLDRLKTLAEKPDRRRA